MDVTFNNVLEGARQYFQGLPTGNNSMVSHAYPSESHRQQNELEQGRELPPASGAYWSQQASEAGQKATSQSSESSRPQSHPPYAHDIQNDKCRPPYPGPFHDQYQQHQSQNFQFSRPQSREAPPNNAQYQSHIPSNSPYQQVPSSTIKTQSTSMQYQAMNSTYQTNAGSMTKPTSAAQYQAHIAKNTPYNQPRSPTVKPPPSNHYQSSSSPYLQPHSPTVKPPLNIQQFSYGQSYPPNVKPPSTHYQSHVPASSPYHQSPSPTVKPYHQAPSSFQQSPSPLHQAQSPLHQAPSPQLPRVPSREQSIPRVPSREQSIPRVPSREQSIPSREQPHRVAAQEQVGPLREKQAGHYPQASEDYNNYSQTRPYYANQQSTNKQIPTSNSYKIAPTSQPYPTTSHENDIYYKHIYSTQSQSQHPVPYSNSRLSTEQNIHNSEQGFRTTHNLPPIAAISNYNSSRNVRETARPANPTGTRVRTSNSCTFTTTTQSANTSASIIQQTSNRPYAQTVTTSSYADYKLNTTQSHSHGQYVTTTAATQLCNQVITTSSANSLSYYAVTNQNQSSSQQYYQQQNNKSNSPRTQAPTSQQTSSNSTVVPDHNLNGRLMLKRESPLDLSVKTVRTPADSTLSDADNEARNKLYHSSRSNHISISTHNYPQVDVNSFQRNLSQRAGQLPTATAPKVEFRPNFNVPPLVQPRLPIKKANEDHRKNMEKAHSNSRPLYESKNVYQNLNTSRYAPVSNPSAAHINSYMQTQSSKSSSNGPPKMAIPNYKSSMYPIPNQDCLKKRPREMAPSLIPSKQPKVDNWRQSIDLQIEERLSSYQQQHAKGSIPPANKPTAMNGGYSSQERPKDIYSSYQKHSYETVAKQPTLGIQDPYQTPVSHSQTYVPSPASHQYSNYGGFPSQTSQPGIPYLQSSSRSNSVTSLTTLTNSKNSLGGAVDKRTLSILKNSIEVKGRKKLEQQKTHEHYTNHPRSDVQHPSTDVTAPLQPKPGLIGRNNISPFTPTSFPDNTKFHLPKAIDSVNFDSKDSNPSLEKQPHDTVITNHSSSNPEFDGLAAFLAARIRTKGELKQVGATAQTISNNNTSNEAHLQVISDIHMKSPLRQEYISQTCSSSSSVNTSPTKALKERQALAPRKRLFSRNEEDSTNNSIPLRDKSGLRSSSETSVFDFPDSDSENDISGRESLEAMRKGRRSSKQSSTPLIDTKPESPDRAANPEDDIFAKLCENFVEQLKNNPAKKKIKKKKVTETESVLKQEVSPCEKLTELNRINIEEPVICANVEDVDMKDIQSIEELPTVTQIKEEPTDNKFPEESKSELGNSDFKRRIEEEQKSNPDINSKEQDPVFVSKQQNVKRRIITSIDSESENELCVRSAEQKIKSESADPSVSISISIKQEDIKDKSSDSPMKPVEILPFIRPAKKPSFGDGSDFYPGWEEGVYKYKKALRMPPSLIQVSRPPKFHRLSTSLPDLDPYPQSPTTSIPPEAEKDSGVKSKIKKVKSECLDSDNESNSSFNLFTRKTNYDSEGSASVRSLPNTAKEMSILDRLLEKCGGKKKRKYNRKGDHSPKVIPKAESPMELMPTPSLEIKEEDKDKEMKKLSSPVIKTDSALLGFSKRTINNFKDAFIKKQNNILGVNEQFTTVVLKSRTRKETRYLKQRATIKEVFGEDRPASAPPVTCVNDIQQEEVIDDNSKLGGLVVKLERPDDIIERVKEAQPMDVVDKENDRVVDTKQVLKNKLMTKGKKKDNNLLKTLVEKKIKIEIQDDIEDDNRSLEDLIIKRDPDEKSETPSIDGDEGSISGKKRTKLGKMRRKLSSGFDYIRKKKKIKKDSNEIETAEKKKRKNVVTKAPESIDDIQKEIKTWVLNKGIGETHLHRAARLGYTDVMAYCLENLQNNPSPKDNAGYTPLHVACTRGHLEIAKLLLLYGANPSESAQGGIRPLHEAVENGFVEITRLLLSYGADPTLATYSGLTPLALTNDEPTKEFLKNHLNDIEGEPSKPWELFGPSSSFDQDERIGYDILDDAPEPDPESEGEDIDFEVSEQLLPNLYTLRGEPASDRWVLLQDLSSILKIKSRDALLRQICPPASSSSASVNHKSVLRELKMSDFLEQAHCCQFLNAGEKINTRASKIALVKYSNKVKELLGVENELIEGR